MKGRTKALYAFTSASSPHCTPRVTWRSKHPTLRTARTGQDLIFPSTFPTQPGSSQTPSYKMQWGRCVPKRFTRYNKTLLSNERQTEAKHKSNFSPVKVLMGERKNTKGNKVSNQRCIQIKGTSLVVQWLRVCAPSAAGAWVQSLVRKLDPTYLN